MYNFQNYIVYNSGDTEKINRGAYGKITTGM